MNGYTILGAIMLSPLVAGMSYIHYQTPATLWSYPIVASIFAGVYFIAKGQNENH